MMCMIQMYPNNYRLFTGQHVGVYCLREWKWVGDSSQKQY